ncbi:hypothetical protein [Botrimarina mediterranea]|uniref:hypothetical protein n=1 Tax=Botrimarina mediterranea TaxID=2528022 RepID=UPI001189D940|nr:hypothetical protein K2D_10840 [Planctomycetes bacterium K2D]
MRSPLRGWRLLLFARCDDASQTESDEWDGPVGRDRWWAARLHRLSCGPCRREAKQMRWLRRLLTSAPDKVRVAEVSETTAPPLSPEAAERIRQSLAAARDSEQA